MPFKFNRISFSIEFLAENGISYTIQFDYFSSLQGMSLPELQFDSFSLTQLMEF